MPFLVEIVALASVISTAELRREFPVSPGDEVVLRDTISRWTKKVGSRSAMHERIPIVVHLSKQRCVVLMLRVPALGGTPSYCYRPTEDVLIEANEDVE
jgi:hypothetical protein